MSKPKFHIELKIRELTNIPQNTGNCYIKWYLKDSAKPDARGRTGLEPIKDHRASWQYEGETTTRIGIDRERYLRHSWIVFDVVWEHGNGKMSLGKVELNLAEYVNRDNDMNRYLLKDSKINSILSVVIKLRQAKGSTDYTVPQFTSPQLFGDITGVMDEHEVRASRRQEGSILSNRKKFLIHWDPKPGDLTPEACIEDIFNGGDGFGEHRGVLPGLQTLGIDDDDEYFLDLDESDDDDTNSGVVGSSAPNASNTPTKQPSNTHNKSKPKSQQPAPTTSTSSTTQQQQQQQQPSTAAATSKQKTPSTSSSQQNIQPSNSDFLNNKPGVKLLLEEEEFESFTSWTIDTNKLD